MSEITNVNITRKKLEDMRILKYDNKDRPKIWVSDDKLYKKDNELIMKLHKEDFEIFSEYEELKNCIFPTNTFSVDNKYFGYITPYYEEYKSICYRMYKNKYSINQKKKLMKKIVKLVKAMNDLDIVHADLNTCNIISNGKDIKLIDFDRIRIREYEDKSTYEWRIKDQIYYMNIALLTMLLDVNLGRIMNSEFKDLVNDISFSNEFKKYLLDSSSHKINEIPNELLEYIDSINKKDITKGKELIKTLQL